MILPHPDKMLFALLRAGLHGEEIADEQLFLDASPEDWQACYNTASKQGVLAIAWDGLCRLRTDAYPPRKLRLTWGLSVDSYESRYRRYCEVLSELAAIFAARGISTMQIKGVGLSTIYPVPSHREGGDIDIYTFSSDKSKMSDEQASEMADQIVREMGIKVDVDKCEKHSSFYYKGIPFENHKSFVSVNSSKLAPRVERILLENLAPQTTELLDAKCTILTPSPLFNFIFVSFHAFQHFGYGLALHHLCDWALLVEKYGMILPEEIDDKYYLKGVSAFNQLCNIVLGMSIPVQGEDRLAHEMLQEMLYPKYQYKLVPSDNKLYIFVYKLLRFIHVVKLQNRVLYLPIWSRVWISLVAHLKNPKSIFIRG